MSDLDRTSFRSINVIYGIYSAASAMNSATHQHEVAAHNLAHVQLPGFRRTLLLQQTEEAARQEYRRAATTQSDQQTTPDPAAIDFTPGPMEVTGNSLHLAIDGDGFFAVEGPGGPLYTRNGAFQIDGSGKLVTADGLSVQAEQGEIVLPPGSSVSEIKIGPDGGVSLNGVQVAKLRIVNFDDPQQLIAHGATLYAASDGTSPVASDATIAQGVLEHANVHPIDELVRLIAASRAYEVAQRSMKALDESIQQHTNLQGG